MAEIALQSAIQFFVITTLISCITSLPNYIEKCEPGDKQCILKNINTLFKTKFEGDKSFGLEDLDPVKFGNFAIKQDPKSSVNINLKFTNTLLSGIKNMKAVKVKGFGNTPDERHDVLLIAPTISLYGNYEVNGKVLILPVQGKGFSNLTITNPQIKISINGQSAMKNNQLFMDVKSTDLEFDIERLYMQFDNLFNGDKLLGESINKFINENWRLIFMDLKPAFTEALNAHLYDSVKRIFSTTPYTELFNVKS